MFCKIKHKIADIQNSKHSISQNKKLCLNKYKLKNMKQYHPVQVAYLIMI